MKFLSTKHGIYATLMAEPMEAQPGGALHLHQSVVDVASGRSLFSEEDGSDSQLFRSFIAGLQKYGMVEGLEPTEPLVGSAYKLEQGLARDLFAALDLMEDCLPLHDIFGHEFVKLYCAIKRVEHETHLQVISPWEREHLLLNV